MVLLESLPYKIGLFCIAYTIPWFNTPLSVDRVDQMAKWRTEMERNDKRNGEKFEISRLFEKLCENL